MSTSDTSGDCFPPDREKAIYHTLELVSLWGAVPLHHNFDLEKRRERLDIQSAYLAQRIVALATDPENGLSLGQRLYSMQHIELAFAPGTPQHVHAIQLRQQFATGEVGPLATKEDGPGTLAGSLIERDELSRPRAALAGAGTNWAEA